MGRNEGFRAVHDNIRLDLPSVRGPFDGRRGIFGIAFRRTPVRPFRDRVNFALVQRPVVGEMANFWISEPWRHLTGYHGKLHGLGPRPHAFVVEERHGRDLARTMTALTVLFENRQYVLAKCWTDRRCLPENDACSQK